MQMTPAEYLADNIAEVQDNGASLEDAIQNAILNDVLPLPLDYALEILNIIYEAKPNKIIFKEV
jgi:hypothetical protein|tara:strand:+ start:108 stop:299 length:192 start_codon:yes stop_codon:yes gene_type:complete